MPGASLEALTGRLGVGAIAFLGMFLLLDAARIGTFEMIELYGKSTTWGLVGVVPTAVVMYIVGVFCGGTSELVLSRIPALRGLEAHEMLAVSRSGGPVVQQLFADHLRNHELLKGAAVSFLVLAAGSLAEFYNLQPFGGLAWLGGAGGLVLAGLSLAFARRARVQASALAAAANGVEVERR